MAGAFQKLHGSVLAQGRPLCSFRAHHFFCETDVAPIVAAYQLLARKGAA